MNRSFVVSTFFVLTPLICPALVRVADAQAPLAKLTQVQQKVEVSSGTGGAFRAVKANAVVNRGDVVRTGRRSKVDVKFSDGSLVRLGQLSSIEVRGPRNVQIGSGRALISWLSPGRIGTSYAAAEIKGTIVNIDVAADGATFTLYEGATEIVTAKGRQELKPGTEVFARPDGTLSGLRTAAPIFFAQAGSPIELLDAPKSGAFIGSVADVQVKASPARVVQRETVGQSKATEATPAFQPGRAITPPVPTSPTGNGNGNGNGPKDPKDDKGPKKPKDDKDSKGGKDGKDDQGGKDEKDGKDDKGGRDDKDSKDGRDDKDGKGGKKDKTFGGQNLLARTFDGPSANTSHAAAMGDVLTVNSFDASNVSGRVNFSVPLGSAPKPQLTARSLEVQLPPIPPVANASGANDALNVTRAAGELGFDSTRAQERLDELSGVGGKTSGFDARAIGVLGDGGNTAYGARIRGYVARGNFLLDGAVQPLRARVGGQNFDLSAVSDLSLTYRTPKIEAQAGRQRFLNGPTQATLYGSLVRQGGREIMDAVRVSKTFGSMREQRLDLAYLVDAYPRNLPFRVSGLQQGFLARYNLQKKANLGLNAIKYFDLDRSNKLGFSLDGALPLGKSGVELYGEVGRDTFGRDLSSVGLSFPDFYARTGFDVYLEAAYLSSSDNAARPPAEFALRAYRRVNDNVDLVGSLSRFSDGNTSALIGLSVGSKRAR